MQLAEKKQFVEEFKEELKNAQSVIVTHYQGLDVNGINTLRRKLKAADCKMRVIKNRLALRAIEESAVESYLAIKDFLKGPTAILIGNEDPSSAIKVFKEYADENDLMEFKAAVIKDSFFDSSQVIKIADLPSRDIMIAKTVMVLNAPIQGLYNSLSGIIKKFGYALNDLKDKMEKGEIKSAGTQEEKTEPASDKTETQETEEDVKVKEVKENETEIKNEDSISDSEAAGADVEETKEESDKNGEKSEKQEG